MSGVGVPSLSRPTTVTRPPAVYAPTVHPYLISETVGVRPRPPPGRGRRRREPGREPVRRGHVTPTAPAAVIVMAAGKGTRMRSVTPKVLHRIGGRSLVDHAVTAARGLEPQGAVGRPAGGPGVREQGTGRAVQIGQQEEGQDGDEHQAGAVNEETSDESGRGTCRGDVPHDEQSGSGGEWGVVHEAIHLDPRGRAGTDRQHRTCEQLQSAPTPRCGAPGDDGMWELSPSGTAHRASLPNITIE